MKIRGKVLLLYLSIALGMLVVISTVLKSTLTTRLNAINQESISSQLSHLNFYLTDLFDGLGSDLNTLMGHPAVTSRQDQDFTSFLNADPKTFQYRYGPTELEIIRIFNNYRTNHKIVSSVYMGRENGSAVRSHPRNEPTVYDPRQRPWYILAKNNPGKVMITQAYPAVTTKDINLGIVKALQDEQGAVFGVVGIDVTLSGLTDFLSNFRFSPGGSLLVVDEVGTILTFSNRKDLLFTKLKDYAPALLPIQSRSQDPSAMVKIQGEDTYVISHSFPSLGWRALVLIPESTIQETIEKPLLILMWFLGFGLTILTLLTFLSLNQMILEPIRKFSTFASKIALTGDISSRLSYDRKDEIGFLAAAWNDMLDSLVQARKRTQVLATAMDRSPAALGIFNAVGILEYSNSAFDQIQQQAPLPPGDLSPGEPRQKLRRRMTESGQEIFENIREYAVKDLGGADILIVLVEDVTQQKIIENRWAQAQKMEELGLVASGVAHDINNLLSGILGLSDLGLVAAKDEAKLKPILDEIKQAADRGASITQNLLKSTRKKDHQFEALDFGDILRSFSSFLHFLIPPEVKFQTAYPPGPLWVSANKGQLEQVFLNLVINARDAMPQGGNLSLRLYSTSDSGKSEAVLEVQDTGTGMTPEVKSRITEPFFTTKAPGKGSGLGLSLVRGILENHQGRLEVESELGKGSVFKVYLPAISQ